MNRILVVDDKEENLCFLQTLLESYGYIADTARHGAEALVKARQTPPCLVISDLFMPVMDGYTLLRQWKADERLKQIPFIVYTATYTDLKDERLALELGADAFIIKPAEPEPFLASLREVLVKAQRYVVQPTQMPHGAEEILHGKYNEDLFRKLEKKVSQLEEANRMLQECTARHHEAEEALLDIRHLLYESQRIAHIGSWRYDMTGRLTWSDEMYHIYGVSPDTFNPKTESFFNLIHSDDRPAMQAWIDACLAGEKPGELEFRIITPDGIVRYISGRGELIYDDMNRATYLAGTAQDITARSLAEEEIRTANEELRVINRIIMACSNVLDTKEILNRVMDDAIRITGLEGGTICLVGSDETLHLAAQKGASEATVQDLTTHTIRVGDCLCGICAKDHMPLILPDRESVLKFATRESTRGEDFRFHAAFPLVTAGKCIGVLCVFSRSNNKPAERSLKLLETMSAQVALAIDNARLYEESTQYAAKLEDKVRVRTVELEQANIKLKEIDHLKSMFIASMSHELRTPLNSVIGFSSILLKQWKGPLNDEQMIMLTNVLRSGKHLLALINDVIDVSKIEAGMVEIHVEEFDMYDLISEAVELMKSDIDEMKLELKIDSIHLVVKTDRRRLLQCVLNLLSNAVKFTERGGVSVQVRLMDKVFMEVAVTDTGIGIREEDIPKLFHAFIRLDSPLRAKVLGTGLGLYLTRKLVTEVLKGVVTVESTYGKGSRFTLKIPLETEKS